MIQQDVQTLQISVQNGLLRRVKVVHTFSNVKGKLLSVVPSHLDLHVVQQTPQRASRTVLKHDAQVWHLCASTKEQNNVWVANDLHDGALVLELFQFVLFNNLALDFFDSDDRVLPAATIYDTIATLGELTIVAQLIKWNLVVLYESSCLI